MEEWCAALEKRSRAVQNEKKSASGGAVETSADHAPKKKAKTDL